MFTLGEKKKALPSFRERAGSSLPAATTADVESAGGRVESGEMPDEGRFANAAFCVKSRMESRSIGFQASTGKADRDGVVSVSREHFIGGQRPKHEESEEASSLRSDNAGEFL